MAVSSNDFSWRNALESILYIASKLATPTKHEVLKVRYFADKFHLEAHGFFGSGDRYVAMEFGPVGSGAYDLLNAAQPGHSGRAPEEIRALLVESLEVGKGDAAVVAKRAAHEEYLSRADIAALDRSIEFCKGMDFEVRTAVSHDAAWKAAWDGRQSKAPPMPITSIAKTLENSEEILEHLAA